MPNLFLSLSSSDICSYIAIILLSVIVITVIAVIIFKSKKKTPPVREPQIGFRGEEDGFVRVDAVKDDSVLSPPDNILGMQIYSDASFQKPTSGSDGKSSFASYSPGFSAGIPATPLAGYPAPSYFDKANDLPDSAETPAHTETSPDASDL